MHSTIRHINQWILSILLFLSPIAYGADLEIIIDKGIENALPIAIVPFGWSQAAGLPPIDISAIISNDLARSGRFAPMEEQDLPQRPNDFAQVNFKDWQKLGMENLVIGQLGQSATGDYVVNFRLLDVYKGKQIVGFSIPSGKDRLRRTAHEIADIIYEKLIGVRGAFATRIAYITLIKNRDGTKKYTLQSADADGFNPQILLTSPEPLLSPAWSPDGKKIAYVSFESKNSTVYVQDVITGKREKIASNPGINSAPAWSPDGSRLAMTLSKDGNAEIYVMNLSSKSLQRVTSNAAIDTEPAWSHNGNMLAFTSDRGGGPQIYEVSASGGEPKRLTFEGPYNARPRYSPDDTKLAVIHVENSVYRIAVVDRKSGQLNILTESRLDESPSFSPNGHMIIYTTTGFRGTELAATSTDGSVHKRLALEVGEVREPAWGPFMNQ
ncbi:MAG: tolB [Gammaproteobacteria bacterium]|nr:tolB [Gammaproteobacteria bacterium]